MKFTLHYFDGLLEVKTFGEAECVKFREILESMVNHRGMMFTVSVKLILYKRAKATHLESIFY